MILKKIEIQGFKSFPNKSALEFSFPIVAIVGPNGSGKSNVAEAFRFVLGEQSKKNLRSKNAKDLIWAGNEFKAKLNRASVAIYFDNKDSVFDMDFDEIKIERVLYSDGANEYFINDSQVRLKDILELLASAKLGASSHHIISQGEADAILNASEKDRMQMIKDALGLNAYHIKLKDAKRKLEKTSENMKEAQIIMRELTPQMRFLEVQIEKKEKIDFLKEELAKNYAIYIYSEKQKIQKEKLNAQNELAKAREIYHSAQSALESFKSKKETPESGSVSLQIKKLEKDLYSATEEYFKIKSSISEKEAYLKVLNNSNANKGGEEFIRVEVSFLNDILDFLLKLSSGNYSKDALQSIISKTKTLIKELESKEEKDLPNTEKIKEELANAKEKLRKLEDKIQKIKYKKSQLQTQFEKINSNQKREERLLELSEKSSRAFAELRKAEMNLQDIKRREDKLLSILSEAKLKSGARFLKIYQELQSGHRKQDKIVQNMDIERLKIKLEELGEVGDEIIGEYKALKEKISFIEKELQDLIDSKEKTELVIEKIESDIKDKSERGVKKISQEFDKFFKILFAGGKAKLDIQKEIKDGEEYELLHIDLQIPGKKLQSMESLSGGERSLVSIALIFAISQVSPPPFIILDETDAALDEANSKRYGEILAQLAQNSQIITITHNRQTMSAAGELYGVTMGKDAISQVFSITLEEAQTVAK